MKGYLIDKSKREEKKYLEIFLLKGMIFSLILIIVALVGKLILRM